MDVYFFVFIVIAFFGLINELTSKLTYSKYYNLLTITILTLVSGLRHYEVGADSPMYVEIFEFLSNNYLINYLELERGYNLLNILISQFISDRQLFVFIMSLFTTLPICIFIAKKNKKQAWLGYVLFVGLGHWIGSMYLMRQWCAISICLLALYFLKNKKKIKCLLTVIIAILFHYSAVIFFIIFFVNHIKRIKLFYLCAVICSAFITLTGDFLFRLISQYTRINYYESGTESGGGHFFFVFLLLLATIPILFNQKKILDTLYYKMILVALALFGLSFTIALTLRALLYFTIAIYIIFPLIINEVVKKRLDRFLLSLVVVVLIGIWYTVILGNDWISPYKFFFL